MGDDTLRHPGGPHRLRATGFGGFGYDPIFEPLSELGSGRTVGDYTAEEKNRVSHRARAARAMARYLKKRYPNQSR